MKLVYRALYGIKPILKNSHSLKALLRIFKKSNLPAIYSVIDRNFFTIRPRSPFFLGLAIKNIESRYSYNELKIWFI